MVETGKSVGLLINNIFLYLCSTTSAGGWAGRGCKYIISQTLRAGAEMSGESLNFEISHGREPLNPMTGFYCITGSSPVMRRCR
jgi:hypothetical protein